MKWIRRVLAVLVLLPVAAVAGLLLAGQRENAGRNSDHIVIDRAPAQVFRHLVESERVRQWAQLAAIESLPSGSLRPGSRLRLVSETRGQRTTMDAEVTGLEPNRLLTLVTRSAPGSSVGFSQRAEYRLEERAGHTRLAVTTDTRYDGAVARLMEPLITRATQSQLEETLVRLKQQVEGELTD